MRKDGASLFFPLENSEGFFIHIGDMNRLNLGWFSITFFLNDFCTFVKYCLEKNVPFEENVE